MGNSHSKYFENKYHSACVPLSQKPTLPLDFTILWAKPLRVGTKHLSQ